MDPAGLTRVERRFRHQRRWRSAAGRRKHPHRHAAPPAPGGGPGRTSSGARASLVKLLASLAVTPRSCMRTTRSSLAKQGVNRVQSAKQAVDLPMRVGDEGYQICSNNQIYSITKSTPSPNVLINNCTHHQTVTDTFCVRRPVQFPPRADTPRAEGAVSGAEGGLPSPDTWRRAWPCSSPRKGPSSRRVRRSSTGRTSGKTSRCSSRQLTSSGRLQSRRLQHQLQLHRRNPRLHQLLCTGACALRHPLLGPRRVLPNPNPPRPLVPERVGASRPRWTRPRGSGRSLASCASRAAPSSSSRRS